MKAGMNSMIEVLSWHRLQYKRAEPRLFIFSTSSLSCLAMDGQEVEIESTHTQPHLATPRTRQTPGLFSGLDAQKDLPLIIAPLSRFSIQKRLIAEIRPPPSFSFRFPTSRLNQTDSKLHFNTNDERLASGVLTVPRLLPAAFRPKLYDGSRDDSQAIFGEHPLRIDVNHLKKRKREQEEQQQLKKRRQEQQAQETQAQETQTDHATTQFPPNAVPVCATPDQQSMCDGLLSHALNNNRSLENISRVFSILYHPASVTLSERTLPMQEQWKVSGKLAFIDGILRRLEDAQTTVSLSSK